MYVYLSGLLYLCLCVLSNYKKIFKWKKDSKTNVTRVNIKKRKVKLFKHCIITYMIFMSMLLLTEVSLIIPKTKNDTYKNNLIRKVKLYDFYLKPFRIRTSIYSRSTQKYQIKRKDLPTILTSLLRTSEHRKSYKVTENRKKENIKKKLNKHCQNVTENKTSKKSSTLLEYHRFDIIYTLRNWKTRKRLSFFHCQNHTFVLVCNQQNMYYFVISVIIVLYTLCFIYLIYIVIVYEYVLYAVSKLTSKYRSKHNRETDYNNIVIIQLQKRKLVNIIIFTGNSHVKKIRSKLGEIKFTLKMPLKRDVRSLSKGIKQIEQLLIKIC